PPTQPPPWRRGRARGFWELVAAAKQKVHARKRVFPRIFPSNRGIRRDRGAKSAAVRAQNGRNRVRQGPGMTSRPTPSAAVRLSWPDVKPGKTTTTRHFRSAWTVPPIPSTASNARSMRWRRPARTAASASSDTASKRTAPSSAASIARKPLASPVCAIGSARRRDRNRERGAREFGGLTGRVKRPRNRSAVVEHVEKVSPVRPIRIEAALPPYAGGLEAEIPCLLRGSPRRVLGHERPHPITTSVCVRRRGQRQ